MGRQIQLHMLPNDVELFLSYVCREAPVAVVHRDSDSPSMTPLSGLELKESGTLCFWNKNLVPSLKREFIPESDEGPYYRLDTLNLPLLEFGLSFRARWDRKPALGQGRLFGNFEAYLGKPPEFEKWYETLVRWLRKNFRRNPTGFGGCVGPAAYEFFEKGGYLLPNFVPPRTREWLREIHKQHHLRTTKMKRVKT
jgi:hypothetical protein